jgi:uncharacterized protein YjbJ (UPF0337 family)
MSGTTDIVKGRIKEAAAALTGNVTLREAGKADQEIGEAKRAARKALDAIKDAAKEAVAHAREDAEETVSKAIEKATNAKKAKNVIGD